MEGYHSRIESNQWTLISLCPDVSKGRWEPKLTKVAAHSITQQ